MRVPRGFRHFFITHQIVSISGALIVGALLTAIGMSVFTKNTNNKDITEKTDTNISTNSPLLSGTNPVNGAFNESKPTSGVNKPTVTTNNSTGSSVPNQTSSSTQAQAPVQQAPATLPNCTYGTGPHSGEHCPVSPPPSWSYSANWHCSNNGIYVPCGAYEDTTLISSYTYNSKDFCQFYYSAGYKIVQVFDYHKYPEVDCSTAIAM